MAWGLLNWARSENGLKTNIHQIWVYSEYRKTKTKLFTLATDKDGGEGVNSKKGCFGRKAKFSGTLKVLSRIGRLRRSSGDFGDLRETRSKKLKFWIFFPESSGRYSRISGGLLFILGSAQTAFVRVVTPCHKGQRHSSKLVKTCSKYM